LVDLVLILGAHYFAVLGSFGRNDDKPIFDPTPSGFFASISNVLLLILPSGLAAILQRIHKWLEAHHGFLKASLMIR